MGRVVPDAEIRCGQFRSSKPPILAGCTFSLQNLDTFVAAPLWFRTVTL